MNQTPGDTLAVIAMIIGVISVVSNVVAVIIMLYVKSIFGPLKEKVEAHSKLIDEEKTTRREGERDIWKKLGDLGERVSRIEGHRSSKNGVSHQ